MSIVKTLFESVNPEIPSDYEIVEEHPIFKGHFPNQPILPAVVMIQLIKTEAERQASKTLQLKKVINAKFLSVVNPRENKRLSVDIQIDTEESVLKVKGEIIQGETVVMNISSVYQVIV